MACVADRDKIIEHHTDFVRRVVLRTVERLGLKTEEYDEYLSAGFLALVEAAERFDTKNSASFPSYAYLRIRGAVIDYLRQKSELTGYAYKYARALKAIENVEMDYLEEIANIPRADKKAVLAKVLSFAAKGAVTFRLCNAEAEEELQGVTDPKANPEEKLLQVEKSKILRECVGKLPEKEKFIIEQYYFSGKSFVDLTIERPELTKSWISRLHTRALERLSKMMEESLEQSA